MARWEKIQDAVISQDSEDEIVELFRKISSEAHTQAVAESDAACAWLESYHLKQDVANLGKKINNVYGCLFDKYDNNYEVAKMAIQWFWFSQYHYQLAWKGFVAAGLVKDSDITRELAATLSPGYEGDLGSAFADCLLDQRISNTEKDDGKDILEILIDGIAMAWFCKADDLMVAGKTTEALDVIADAYSALEQARVTYTWEKAWEWADRVKINSARIGAIEKLKRDPKQKEKAFIQGCWEEWQNNPERYASKAAFAKDMIAKCEHLKSQKKVEDWCRAWEKPNPAS